jgi:hypothetical protein
MEVSCQFHTTDLIPGPESPGTNRIGGLVGPRASLHAVEYRQFSCSCRETNLDTQPSRYTDSYPDNKVPLGTFLLGDRAAIHRRLDATLPAKKQN